MSPPPAAPTPAGPPPQGTERAPPSTPWGAGWASQLGAKERLGARLRCPALSSRRQELQSLQSPSYTGSQGERVGSPGAPRQSPIQGQGRGQGPQPLAWLSTPIPSRPQPRSGPPPEDCSIKNGVRHGKGGRRDAGEGELSPSWTVFPWGFGAGERGGTRKGVVVRGRGGRRGRKREAAGRGGERGKQAPGSQVGLFVGLKSQIDVH